MGCVDAIDSFGDYFIPDLKLPEETRPIGKWGRMHRKYLKEHHPVQFNNLVLSGNLWTYFADLNEQALQRMDNVTVFLFYLRKLWVGNSYSGS